MRIAIVGAGLAGLATGAAFSRAGHDVQVFEQADGLRASGLAINLWSNATSLLPAFGIPADRIPGEPFSRMVWRAGGHEVTSMELPPRGLPHVNVQRAGLLSALAAALPADAISFGTRCSDVAALAIGHDLVVVADGANSALRAAVTRPPRRQWNWTVWQATVTVELPEVPKGAGASVLRAGTFAGIWRLSGGTAHLVRRAAGTQARWRQASCSRTSNDDEDPVLRTLAQATLEQGELGFTSGTPGTCGQAGRCTAATSCWSATPRTPCCPRSARAPASAWKTPPSSPRRSPPRPRLTVRSAATRRHGSPASAGSPRWPGPEPSAGGPTRQAA